MFHFGQQPGLTDSVIPYEIVLHSSMSYSIHMAIPLSLPSLQKESIVDSNILASWTGSFFALYEVIIVMLKLPGKIY